MGGLHRLPAIRSLDREYQRREVVIMTTRCRIYIHTVLHLYLQMPGTPERICSHDRRLAEQWFARQIPIPIIETALLVGVGRRTFRRQDAFPVGADTIDGLFPTRGGGTRGSATATHLHSLPALQVRPHAQHQHRLTLTILGTRLRR